MAPYAEVPFVLRSLADNDVDLAVASRTTFPDGAHSLISLFGWDGYFKHREIYPGSKTAHFAAFKQRLSCPYDHMLFFDNEDRNITDVSALGVTSILVDENEGVTMKIIGEGIRRFAAAQRAAGS